MSPEQKPQKLVPKYISLKLLKFWWGIAQIAYTAGNINENEYQLIMNLMIASDSKGNLWTVGTESGQFYVKQDEQWVRGQPEDPLIWLVPEDSLKQVEAEVEEVRRKMEAERRAAQTPAEPQVQPPATAPATAPATVPEPSSPPAPKKVEPVEDKPDTLICMQCEAELLEGAKFCMNCGAPVQQPEPEEPEPAVCPACGAELPDAARFCPECGAQRD